MKSILEKLDAILRNPNTGKKEDVALMLNYKAQLCYLSNDFHKAIKRQKQALEIVPEINASNAHLHSNLYSNMGMYYMRKKKLPDAEWHMKRAVEILKDYEEIRNFYGNKFL